MVSRGLAIADGRIAAIGHQAGTASFTVVITCRSLATLRPTLVRAG